MSTQVILLEKVENLGALGDVVSVKPGFARNYLLPKKKALRASKANIAYFEAQKKGLEAANNKAKSDAEKLAKKIDGAKAALVRQASESGQLFGSVTSRDIAEAIAAETKETITRNMISINRNFKMIGLFPVDVMVHPEVKAEVTINIARTPEEAEIQAKSGRALIAEAETKEAPKERTIEEADEMLADVLEDSALEIEKDKAEAAEADAAKEAESEAKSAERKAKKDAKAAEEAEVETAAEGEEAPAEETSSSEDAPAEEEAADKAE
ncbi:50S ribosomal protein L9 [Alphaproteobacteria bacterium]|nr:50S ribosomal protein L9 [Alphaproteobacteria bacterium]